MTIMKSEYFEDNSGGDGLALLFRDTGCDDQTLLEFFDLFSIFLNDYGFCVQQPRYLWDRTFCYEPSTKAPIFNFGKWREDNNITWNMILYFSIDNINYSKTKNLIYLFVSDLDLDWIF